MKTLEATEIKEITIYGGYSEMILQEDYKKHSTGSYSDVAYVTTQTQYYAFSDNSFEKVNVEGVSS